MLDELGDDGVLGGSGRLTHKLLVLHSIQSETEGESSFGAVKSASFTATAKLTPVKRVSLGSVRRGIFAILSVDGSAVGVSFWDDDGDDDTTKDPDFWICPVYQVRQMVDGWGMSDCLILKKSEKSEGAFERVAKARVQNNWIEGTVKKVITVV